MDVITRNLVALMGSQLASWMASLVIVLVVPHYLADSQFGRINFAWSYAALFGLIAGLGSASFITKMTARNGSILGSYVFNALVMKVLLMMLLSAIAVAAVWAVGYPRETCLLVAIACLESGFSVMTGTLIAGLQGQQRMGRTAIWAIVERYVRTAVIVVMLVTHRSLVVLAATAAFSGLISLAANGAQIYSTFRYSWRIELRVWKVLVIGGLPFMLWNIVQTIYSTVDVSLLSLMAGDAVVGWYALADRLISIPAFLPFLIMTAFFPALSAHGEARSASFVRLANSALRAVFLICAPMAAGIALIAGDIIAVLHYSAGFAHSVLLIRLLAPDIPLAAVGTVLGVILMASDRQKPWVVVGAVGAVLNVGLNLAAIEITKRVYADGAIGTSAVTVLTEFVMLGGAVYLRPKGVLDKATISFLIRCGIASFAMIPPILAVNISGLPTMFGLGLEIFLGVVIYGLMSLLLRTISLPVLRRVARRFLGSPRLGEASGQW